MNMLRHDWTAEQVRAIYDLPLMELVYRAQGVHRKNHPENEVQLCTLMSIKTGGCPEDCGYCPQSAHFKTGLKQEALINVDEVLKTAGEAKAMGATRFCMGAAWRGVKDGPQFDSVLDMVRGVRALKMEACVTLGLLEEHQAIQLAEAGLTAYNHNLDSSEAHYEKVITTRTYGDRLKTLENVRKAGIGVCCGGILGLGEGPDDRCEMVRTLANMNPQPESVPINQLVPVEGTPLANQEPLDNLEMVRIIALARILLPRTMVRLSAGREDMSQEAQVLCMMAGANSIFYGEELLTTPNPSYEDDKALLKAIGASPLQPAGL
jgi:biotin synthase